MGREGSIDMGERLIALPEVVRKTGMGRSTIYRRIGERSFPAGVDLGGGMVRWKLSEIDAWIEDRPRASHGAPRRATGGGRQ